MDKPVLKAIQELQRVAALHATTKEELYIVLPRAVWKQFEKEILADAPHGSTIPVGGFGLYGDVPARVRSY